MPLYDDLKQLPGGAQFYRADMHIHSYGGSHDVQDTSMTPQAIIKAAVADGLAVVAVTDHNEVANIASVVSAAKELPLLVIPGVELSTPEGHLLAYFRTVEDLRTFFGLVTIAGRGTGDSRCQ